MGKISYNSFKSKVKRPSMHIVFVLRGYPTSKDPYQAFSRELIAEIAKMGHKCSVIAPQSVTRALKHNLPVRPRFWKDDITPNNSINIYQPYYISTSNALRSVQTKTQLYAANKAFHQIQDRIDLIYGHFWDMGLLAAKISNSIPIIIGCGEAYIQKILERMSKDDMRMLQKRIKGVIYVSTHSYHEAVKYGIQHDTPYLIAPNGYNSSRFYPISMEQCRKQLGLNINDFIVSFVGSFDERKGVYRLIEAVKDEPDIKLILIGKGGIIPQSNQIIFSGMLPHEDIVKYLCASNVFVLPTQREGCCNAIIEAIACGLPIISSEGEFNNDILNESNSIRINPNDILEIREAILDLKNKNEKRLTMGLCSKEIAKGLTIKNRAKNIIDFASEI